MTSWAACIMVSLQYQQIKLEADPLGYVHSLMYVGMGLEYKQLPLVAEGLAQAAVHDDMYYNDFLFATERLAGKAIEPALPLSELLHECQNYPSILSCSGPEYHHQLQPNGQWFVTIEMVRDGVCAKAFDDMSRVCARYRVNPDDLERATAELINSTGESAQYVSIDEHIAEYYSLHGGWSTMPAT